MVCATSFFLLDILSPTQNVQLFEEEDEDQGVVPQSSESGLPGYTATQNVMFDDYSPGTLVEIDSQMDDVRSSCLKNDLNLNDFFSRPVLIEQFNWDVNAPAGLLGSSINPWSAFINNKRVLNRVSNFKLMQCKLHVRFLVNGTPFHYGRAMAVYTPLHTHDDVGRRQFSTILNESQKPHIYINPTTCQGGDFCLPFLWPEDAMDLVRGDFNEMGIIDVWDLTTLKHVNGGDSPVQISVFAWATDVTLSCPTHANVDGIQPQSDEYGKKAFSIRATNLANMAGAISNAPVIGPYAKATQMAASAVSMFASLFGFSRPLELDRTMIVPKTLYSTATTNGVDDSHKLTVDSKQEVTVDPRAFGLSNKDEMEITNISTRETFITRFNWAPTSAYPAESLLFNIVVDPSISETIGASAPNIPQVLMSSSCFAALPFQYWRGSMKYRFQIVCSAMHRGRIRIVYDPEGNPTEVGGDPSEYNLGYNTVVDISEVQDFEITVGWGQSTAYREHFPLDTPTALQHSVTPLFYDSGTNTFGNGVLSVYVLNELTSPSTDVDDIYVLVSVSTGDDFEVAAPTSKYLSRLRYRTYSEITPQSSNGDLALGTVPGGAVNTEELQSSLDTLAIQPGSLDNTNEVYFGETIKSFRTLLKRYTMSDVVQIGSVAPDTTTGIVIQRPSFPMEPGYTNKANAASLTTVTSNIGTSPAARPYFYGYLTPLRYISSGFVGWRGGIRWKSTISLPCACGVMEGPMVVTRYSGCDPQNIISDLTTTIGNNFQLQFLTLFDESQTLDDGGQITVPAIEPVLGFESPYMSRYRFLYSRRLASFKPDELTERSPCWKIAFQSRSNVSLKQQFYCSIAEDFNLGMYIGAPVFYLESVPPT